jgi:hypothetical protein
VKLDVTLCVCVLTHQLKELLRSRNLRLSGRKADLADRLAFSLQEGTSQADFHSAFRVAASRFPPGCKLILLAFVRSFDLREIWSFWMGFNDTWEIT